MIKTKGDKNVKRTTIFLREDIHKGLKHLAIEKDVSMADLLRDAIENVYREDLEDILLAREARKEYLKNPGRAKEASQYFHKKGKKPLKRPHV